MNFGWRFAASALVVWLVAVLAERLTYARARRVATELRAPSRARRALSLLLAALSPLLQGYSLVLAVGLLMFVPVVLAPRSRVAQRSIPLGHFQPVTGRSLDTCRAAKPTGHLLDATTVPGALSLLALVLALLLLPGAYELGGEPYGFALFCMLPSWFIGSHRRWPRGFDERLGLLARALSDSKLEGHAFRLLAYASEHEPLSEPRARVLYRARYPGLLRVDVLVDTRRDRPPFVLRAIVQRGAASERWITRGLRAVSRGEGRAGGRVALLWPVRDFEPGIEALFALLDRESQRAVERLTWSLARTA